MKCYCCDADIGNENAKQLVFESGKSVILCLDCLREFNKRLPDVVEDIKTYEKAKVTAIDVEFEEINGCKVRLLD